MNLKNIVKKEILIVFLIVAIVLFGLIGYIFIVPFSNKPNMIAKADEAVVKIHCYDFENNEVATGSGFLVYDDKTVVTNYHIMENAKTCRVSTSEDFVYEVSSIICYSKEYDIAMLKLSEGTNLKPLKLGDSTYLKKGEKVTAIGSPLGLKNTVSQGVLSGRVMEDSIYVLQFTAPISNGSSGGALIDESGKVVGVTYASYIEGQNLNLAVPVELVKELYESRSEEFDVSTIYAEAHPYFEILEKYGSPLEVAFSELIANPTEYNGRWIKTTAIFSSMRFNEFNIFNCYVGTIESITGNVDLDYGATSGSTANSDLNSEGKSRISNTHILPVSFENRLGVFNYIEEGLEYGDVVCIVGEFNDGIIRSYVRHENMHGAIICKITEIE